MPQPIAPILAEFLEPTAVDLDEADALLAAGRPKDAIAIYSVAFYEDVDRLRAAAWATRCCLEMRAPHEALAWARWLECYDKELGSLLMAAAFCQLGDFAAAADAAEGCDPEVLARVGLGVDQGVIIRVAAFMRQEAFETARRLLLEHLSASPNPADIWAQLANVVAVEGFAAPDVVAAVPGDEILTIATWMRHGSPVGTELVLEALWSRQPGSRPVLAAASESAPFAPLDRAMVWAGRFRTIGLVSRCPIRARAQLSTVPAIERVQAAVITHAAFGDDDAAELLWGACAALPVDAIETALTVVAELDMSLLDVAVDGAAHDVPHALVVARFLYEGGATDGALAVVAHALALADADPIWTVTATRAALLEHLGSEVVAAAATGLAAAGAAQAAAVLRAATA